MGNMKKHCLLIAVVGAVSLFVMGDAWAGCGKGMGRGGHEPGQGRGDMLAFLARTPHEMSLNADQASKLRQLYFDQKAQRIQARAAVDQAGLAVRRLQDAYEVDEAQLRKAVDALADAQKQALQNRIGQALAIRTILTKEQYEEASRLRREERCGSRGMISAGQKKNREHGKAVKSRR